MSSVSNTRRLRSLLNAAKADQRLTLDRIVVRGEGRVGRSHASNLTKELNRAHPLTRDELADIALAFGVDYEVLRTAHLLDMGLIAQEEDTDGAAIALPAGMHRLTERQRAAVAAVVRAMLEPEGEPLPATSRDRAQEYAPATEAEAREAMREAAAMEAAARPSRTSDPQESDPSSTVTNSTHGRNRP